MAACGAWAAVLAIAPRGLVGSRVWPAPTAWAALALAGVGLLVAAVAPGVLAMRLALALLAQTTLALALFDARFLLIPDVYLLPYALAGLAGPLAPGLDRSALGAAVGLTLFAGVRWAVGRAVGAEAMGWGDVKLAGVLGLLLGPSDLLWTVGVAASGGAAWGWLRRGSTEAPLRLPFGAFLAGTGLVFAAAAGLR